MGNQDKGQLVNRMQMDSRHRWLIVAVVSAILVALILPFVFNQTRPTVAAGSSPKPPPKSSELRAHLIKHTGKLSAAAPPEVMFLIENISSKPQTLDGRLAWPGCMDLYVKLPDGRVARATRLAVRLPNLQKEDILVLQPGRVTGVVLKWPASGPSRPPELKNMRPGRYVLWVNWYGYSSEKQRGPTDSTTVDELKCPSWNLESNKLVLELK